jgi:methionyl-tRNA formyltransferase
MSGLRVLLIGEDGAGIQTLLMLAETTHTVVGVMASPTKSSALASSLWRVACARGYHTWPAELVKDATFACRLKNYGVDLILNVHSLYLIRKEILCVPTIGSFNLHPGPLPEYAGLSAPSWAIYHGARRYAVTLHWMDTGIDTGDIAFTAPVPISRQDTGLTLSAACVRAGVPLIASLLRVAAWNPDHIPAIAQDLARRHYFGRTGPHPHGMPWDLRARRLDAFVRACNYRPFPSPWGRPISMLGDRRIEILKTSLTGERCSSVPGTVVADDGGTVRVATADDWLRIERIALDGRSSPPTDVLREGVILAPPDRTRA